MVNTRQGQGQQLDRTGIGGRDVYQSNGDVRVGGGRPSSTALHVSPHGDGVYRDPLLPTITTSQYTSSSVRTRSLQSPTATDAGRQSVSTAALRNIPTQATSWSRNSARPAVCKPSAFTLRSTVRIATWNVLTLAKTGYVEAICQELLKYRVNVAGLTETHLTGTGQIHLSSGTLLYAGEDNTRTIS